MFLRHPCFVFASTKMCDQTQVVFDVAYGIDRGLILEVSLRRFRQSFFLQHHCYLAALFPPLCMLIRLPYARLHKVCGSYRRGKSTCGDIDILITHKQHDKNLTGVLDKLVSGGWLHLTHSPRSLALLTLFLTPPFRWTG
jgi:hypothetical protein